MSKSMPEPMAANGEKDNPASSVTTLEGLFIHAAAIQGNHGAILLMGHSSSGKTTLSSLLSAHFPVITDDLVFAHRRQQDVWRIMDGSRLKSIAYENGCVYGEISPEAEKAYPLCAIIRIFGAQHTTLQPLPPIKTCEYLMDAVFEIDLQRATNSLMLANRWFHLTALMARQCPGWQLCFTLDEQLIVPLLKQLPEK